MTAVHAVIMAGGSGTRFWPASRQTRPKQLLSLSDGVPMIAAAVARVATTCRREHIWIATNGEQRSAILALMPDFPADQVIVEPAARDTAPCVALAVATIASHDPDAAIVVLPADQVIEPAAEVQRMLNRGVELAADGETLVTFGIPPTFPATGYGYIALGAPRDEAAPRAFVAEGFREKPDRATAEQFVADGKFWWNSGIVAFRAGAMRAQMQRHCPELFEATEGMIKAIAEDDRSGLEHAFAAAPKTSIDFAVMEKDDKLAVVECTADWDDVGSCPALARILDGDDADNHRSLHDGAAAALLGTRATRRRCG